MQTKIILASLLATAVSANNLLALRQVNTPLGDLSPECQADLAEVQKATDLPTIPTAFISDAFIRAQTLTDPCAYTLTGTVASEYTSFVQAAESWASVHTSIASKVEKDCNAALQNIANLCPAGKAGVTATSGAGAGEPAATPADGEVAKSTGGAGEVGKNAAVAHGPAAATALLVAALGAIALL